MRDVPDQPLQPWQPPTYTVDGTYFYRVTAGNLDTSTGEENFVLTFP